MQPRVLLEPEAGVDLAEAFAWYDGQRPGLGSEFLAEVARVFEVIEQAPDRYAIIRGQTRRALAARILVLLALVGSVDGLQAQVPLQPGNTVLFAQWTCDPVRAARADTLVQTGIAPVLNRYIAEGRLIAWGWVSTYIGQTYNRGIYLWARSPVALFQARETYLPELMAMPTFTEFSRICGAPSTSIHNLVTQSPGESPRPRD